MYCYNEKWKILLRLDGRTPLRRWRPWFYDKTAQAGVVIYRELHVPTVVKEGSCVGTHGICRHAAAATQEPKRWRTTGTDWWTPSTCLSFLEATPRHPYISCRAKRKRKRKRRIQEPESWKSLVIPSL
jgi:hypothetical protein